jgi:hypothetical protein
VLNAGFEPFAGFLHVDRPGKPSLILGMVEEFRQPVVDRTVIAYVNLGTSIGMRDGLLDADTRKVTGDKIVERLVATEPYQGKQYQIRSIIRCRRDGWLRFCGGRASTRHSVSNGDRPMKKAHLLRCVRSTPPTYNPEYASARRLLARLASATFFDRPGGSFVRIV